MADPASLNSLSFVPMVPEVGSSHELFILPSPKAPESAMAAIVYEDPSFDRILVREYVDSTSQDDWLAWEESLVDEGCQTDANGEAAIHCQWDAFTQVKLGDGVVGLFGSSPPAQEPAIASIQLVLPLDRTPSGRDLDESYNLIVAVQGYAETFSKEEAIAVGRSFVEAAR